MSFAVSVGRFRSTKAAIKMHTLLDLRGPIPSFIHISDGKMGDALALDLITPEAGAIYVMDRGYVDFQRLYVTPFQVRSATVQHRQHGGVNGRGKGRGQGL